MKKTKRKSKGRLGSIRSKGGSRSTRSNLKRKLQQWKRNMDSMY